MFFFLTTCQQKLNWPVISLLLDIAMFDFGDPGRGFSPNFPLECKNKSVKIIDSFHKGEKKGVIFYHSTLNYTLSKSVKRVLYKRV